MIVPRMPLHICRLGHVAIDTLVASAVCLMKAVRFRSDGGGIEIGARRVALHAEVVSFEQSFC